MIRLRVAGPNFDDLIRTVELMAHPDLRPLAERVRQAMLDDNREGLLAGIDCFGDPSADLEESTIRRGRPGDGPPLVPREGGSRMIDDYRVEIREEHDRILLVGMWPGTPFVHFHATGTKHMVARDPIGIRPAGLDRIARELADFGDSLASGGAP